MSHGIISTEYPNSWRKTLESITGWGGVPTASATVYKIMQELFPGPYRIQDRFDNERAKYDRFGSGYFYTLEWDSEEERVMWLMKYPS